MSKTGGARDGVSMVVVGDGRVGKTSLITTLVSSIFPETVPSVLQQVHVPPEDTTDNIALSISDTSSDPEHRTQVLEQVRTADVTIIVFSGDHPESFERVKSYWMKEVSQVFSGPVIIVGNKIDLAPSDNTSDRAAELQRNISPLLKEYKQIDACLECSAKLNMNVNEVFYFAQQAVVYPITPLFDTHTHELKPAFKTALSRIFRVFDRDRDGMLSDSELNEFQEQCFGVRLQPADIDGVKKVLQKEAYKYVSHASRPELSADGFNSAGITLEGFLFLNKLFIQRNRAETTWLILRRFGYDDSLELKVSPEELLLPRARDQSVELSKQSLSFLAAIFHQFDKDNDGALSPAELSELFSICPAPSSPWSLQRSPTSITSTSDALYQELAANPSLAPEAMSYLADFPRGVSTNENGYVTLDGWLAQWSMTTLIQPYTSALFLKFLGGLEDVGKSLFTTRRRKLEDQENALQRSVVRCFVFGSPGVGKSTLLDALARKSGPTTASRSVKARTNGGPQGDIISDNLDTSTGSLPRSAASMVLSRMDKGKGIDRGSYLILTKVPASDFHVSEALNGMVDCDLVVLMFDEHDPASVDYLATIQQQIPESVPCVYLANTLGETRVGDGTQVGESSSVGGTDAASGKAYRNNVAMASADGESTFEDQAATVDGFAVDTTGGSPTSSAATSPAHGVLTVPKEDFGNGGCNTEAFDKASALCSQYNLADPERVALHELLDASRIGATRKVDRLFELLMTIALRPDTARPISDERRAARRRMRLLKAGVRVTAVLATFAISGFMFWSFGLNHNKPADQPEGFDAKYKTRTTSSSARAIA